MSVPKGKRRESQFDAHHNLIKLRKEVTELTLHNFGFSLFNYEVKLRKLEFQYKDSKDKEEKIKEMRRKYTGWTEWFIQSEREAVINLVREIVKEFTIANSIYPSQGEAREREIAERRLHLDLAIAHCYALTHEIEYAMETLPVNKNKYKRFAEMIDKQINLFKGVRKADSRFSKMKLKSANKNTNESNKQKTNENTTANKNTTHDSVVIENKDNTTDKNEITDNNSDGFVDGVKVDENNDLEPLAVNKEKRTRLEDGTEIIEYPRLYTEPKKEIQYFIKDEGFIDSLFDDEIVEHDGVKYYIKKNGDVRINRVIFLTKSPLIGAIGVGCREQLIGNIYDNQERFPFLDQT